MIVPLVPDFIHLYLASSCRYMYIDDQNINPFPAACLFSVSNTICVMIIGKQCAPDGIPIQSLCASKEKYNVTGSSPRLTIPHDEKQK